MYTIRVSANNSLDGKEACKTDTSPPERPILLNSAVYSMTNYTITVKYNFQELTSESDNYDLELFYIKNNNTEDSLLLYNCSIKQIKEFFITVGNNIQNENCTYSGMQFILNPGTVYDFKINLTNRFDNKISQTTYYRSYSTSGEFQKFNNYNNFSLFALLVLLPIIFLIIFAVMYVLFFLFFHLIIISRFVLGKEKLF